MEDVPDNDVLREEVEELFSSLPVVPRADMQLVDQIEDCYLGAVDEKEPRIYDPTSEPAKSGPSEAYKHTEEILARRALEPGADPEEERRERFKKLWEEDEPSAVHLFLSRMSSQSS